jgi:hypothetical protein
MADQGRLEPTDRRPVNGRNRRVSPVAAHSGDRLLSEPIAGTQSCRRNRSSCPKGDLSSDPRIELVIAGEASQSAQKVHNLLAALATLQPQDRVVVLADTDIVPRPIGLERLIRPIALHRAGDQRLSLANPGRPRLASRIVALADVSIATAARDSRWNQRNRLGCR